MLRHLMIAIQKWVPVHFRFVRKKIDNQLLEVPCIFFRICYIPSPKLEFAFPIVLYLTANPRFMYSVHDTITRSTTENSLHYIHVQT